MNRLVAAAMLTTLATLAAELIADPGPHWPGWASLVLVVSAVGLAATRTVGNAVRLGARRDPLARQRVLARSVGRDHLFCLGAIASTLALQLAWAR